MSSRGDKNRRVYKTNFTWKGLKKNEVHRQCRTCHICQVTKKVHKNYGKLPPRKPEVTPWEFLGVDIPQKVILDRGTEFMAEFSKMIQDDYGIKKKPITKRNPQANIIVERFHQTIGNMIRTFEVQEK